VVEHPESEWPPPVTSDMTADEALEFVLAWLDTGPDAEMLSRSALTQMEPLVDWHGAQLEDRLLSLIATRADVRYVVRCCMFDDDPDGVARRLDAAADSD